MLQWWYIWALVTVTAQDIMLDGTAKGWNLVGHVRHYVYRKNNAHMLLGIMEKHARDIMAKNVIWTTRANTSKSMSYTKNKIRQVDFVIFFNIFSTTVFKIYFPRVSNIIKSLNHFQKKYQQLRQRPWPKQKNARNHIRLPTGMGENFVVQQIRTLMDIPLPWIADIVKTKIKWDARICQLLHVKTMKVLIKFSFIWILL